MKQQEVYDYIIIGSGFGGSVSAMRLSEKGYKVLVIEKGKSYRDEDFPKSDWNLRKFLWAPLIKCFGFQNISFFRQVTILSGVGVGGGSLVYGNTHMFPPDAFFQNKVWAHLKDWKSTLIPFYELARKMLGTVKNEKLYVEDMLLKEVAEDMNRKESFSGVNVGVYFGDTERESDPYFNGHGPLRKGCIECAGCMTGCRHNAKNTLEKNYLWFAKKFGATIVSETLATKIQHNQGIYQIDTRSSTSWFNRNALSYHSHGLIVSGGVLGTLELLLKQKFHYKTLPNLSDTLGDQVLTNSESLCGVSHAREKLNNGVAISSYFNPDEDTHIEVVKYSNEAGAMGRLGTLATGGGSGFMRFLKLLLQIVKHPINFLRVTFNLRHWGENSIIFLVMQSLDNSMRLVWKKGWLKQRMTFRNDKDLKVPAYIPVGQEVMKRYAKKVNGIPQNVWPEILLNMPMTAHILGGCPMGKDANGGVVDEYFSVHNYPDMYILDGSVIPCNLGVNPSLTITALSEYAMSHIPDKEGNKNFKLDDLIHENIF
ncbi:MAG: GMC family oxidoreductase [Cyclobacteriaceae bacterium]|nr:GMC family oxidoreductase [Cyclobacteriaceae bacterium]